MKEELQGQQVLRDTRSRTLMSHVTDQQSTDRVRSDAGVGDDGPLAGVRLAAQVGEGAVAAVAGGHAAARPGRQHRLPQVHSTAFPSTFACCVMSWINRPMHGRLGSGGLATASFVRGRSCRAKPFTEACLLSRRSLGPPPTVLLVYRALGRSPDLNFRLDQVESINTESPGNVALLLHPFRPLLVAVDVLGVVRVYSSRKPYTMKNAFYISTGEEGLPRPCASLATDPWHSRVRTAARMCFHVLWVPARGGVEVSYLSHQSFAADPFTAVNYASKAQQ